LIASGSLKLTEFLSLGSNSFIASLAEISSAAPSLMKLIKFYPAPVT
jgi:hypothetical protein